MLIAMTGFVAGTLHVFSGADHIAALAPLAVEDPRRGLRTGIYWGLGHGLGVVALGGLGMLIGHALPIAGIASVAELAVGGLLVLIGGWAIHTAAGLSLHSHTHVHDGGPPHAHLHLHHGSAVHEAPRAHARHTHAALGVGLLHGIAGSGHLFGVLPSLALPPAEAALYLAAYLFSAVSSMGLVALVLARLATMGGLRALRGLMVGCGLVAISVGAVWTLQSARALL